MAYERVGGGVSAARKRKRSVFRPNYGIGSLPSGLGQSILASIGQQQVPSAASINTAPGALSGSTGGYDVNSDPAVAAAQGLAAKIRANAQASALAKRKQAALEYGDPTGVEGIDEATAKAARENPFSILKNMEHAYGTGKQDLEEGLNKSNLYYSGYRGQQLGEAARSYEQNKYSAGTSFKGLMTDINDQLANALLNADMYEANALLGSEGGSYGGGSDEGSGDGSGGSSPYSNALLESLRRRTSTASVAGRKTSRPPKKYRPVGAGGTTYRSM